MTTTTYTIPVEHGRTQLERLSSITDVKHVAVIDAVGLCLIHSGHEPVSTMLLTGWTVVARAAFSACEDLAQRGGTGPCQESLQTHEEGGTLMRAMLGGMLLIIQFGQKTPVGTLRILSIDVAEALPIAIESRPPPQRKPPPPLPILHTNDPFTSAWGEDAPTPRRKEAGPVVLEAEML